MSKPPADKLKSENQPTAAEKYEGGGLRRRLLGMTGASQPKPSFGQTLTERLKKKGGL